MKLEQWITALEKLSRSQNVHEWEFSENDPRYHVDKTLLNEALYDAISTLTDREQQVIYCRFFDNLTFKATGKVIGLCPQYVSQIESKALRKLRHPKLTKQLEIMLEMLTVMEWDEKQKAKKKEEKRLSIERSKVFAAERRKEEEERRQRNWELARKRQERDREAQRLWDEECARVKEVCNREFAEKPPSFLELAYDKTTSLHFIKCPSWTTFNVPMDVYKRWLNYLMEERKIIEKGIYGN